MELGQVNIARQEAERGVMKTLGGVARKSALAAVVVLCGAAGLYSSLEPYQQERLSSVAIVHIAAMAPAGTFEPYQDERIRRAIEPDS